MLTSHAGLLAVGRLLRERAHLPQVLDQARPVVGGFSDSAVVTSYISMLCQGITPFDAVENMRRDATFSNVLGLPKIPSAPTVRQRVEQRGQKWIVPLFECNSRLLKNSDANPTPLYTGHAPFDLDVFVMNNDDSKKEGIGFSYARVVGYAPVASYVGREGYLLELSLRPGVQHSANETEHSLQHALPVARALTPRPILVRMDSGFDSNQLYLELEMQRAALGALDWIVKWNPRAYNVQPDYQRLKLNCDTEWTELRPGLRSTIWQATILGSQRRVYRLIEETIDRHGQSLLLPKLELDGWNTTLGLECKRPINPIYRSLIDPWNLLSSNSMARASWDGSRRE